MADVNQPGLVQKVNVLCKKYNSSSMILNENNAKAFTSHVKQNMCKALINHQLLLLNSNRKLTFYKFFKTATKKSCFLDAIKNPLRRTAINKFRLGNHQLSIETGRYTIPKTPENLRICSLCQLNEVEKESHVMLTCTFYDKLRSKFFNEVIVKFKSFKDLDNNSRIWLLFNSVDPFICRSVAAFIFEIMNHIYIKCYLISKFFFLFS